MKPSQRNFLSWWCIKLYGMTFCIIFPYTCKILGQLIYSTENRSFVRPNSFKTLMFNIIYWLINHSVGWFNFAVWGSPSVCRVRASAQTVVLASFPFSVLWQQPVQPRAKTSAVTVDLIRNCLVCKLLNNSQRNTQNMLRVRFLI